MNLRYPRHGSMDKAEVQRQSQENTGTRMCMEENKHDLSKQDLVDQNIIGARRWPESMV